MLVAEEATDGVLLRPAAVIPIEIYTRERRAEFLLTNATDAEDYRKAQKDVRKLGLDPAKIRHRKPRKR